MSDRGRARALRAWRKGDGLRLRTKIVRRLRMGALSRQDEYELADLIAVAFRAGWSARERLEQAEGKPQELFGADDEG